MCGVCGVCGVRAVRAVCLLRVPCLCALLMVTATGELWDEPQFMRQWFVELAAKLGVSWTPWQFRSIFPPPQFRPNGTRLHSGGCGGLHRLASFVIRCAGVEPQAIRDFHADIFTRAWYELLLPSCV
jgi:hypothetical protein